MGARNRRLARSQRWGVFHPCHARFRVWPLTSPSTGSGVGKRGAWPCLPSLVLNVAQLLRPAGVCRPVDRSHAVSLLPRGTSTRTFQGRCARFSAIRRRSKAFAPKTREPAGLSDALGDVGTESTPGGHRRPTCPRSGTGSRMGDGDRIRERRRAGTKILRRFKNSTPEQAVMMAAWTEFIHTQMPREFRSRDR